MKNKHDRSPKHPKFLLGDRIQSTLWQIFLKKSYAHFWAVVKKNGLFGARAGESPRIPLEVYPIFHAGCNFLEGLSIWDPHFGWWCPRLGSQQFPTRTVRPWSRVGECGYGQSWWSLVALARNAKKKRSRSLGFEWICLWGYYDVVF